MCQVACDVQVVLLTSLLLGCIVQHTCVLSVCHKQKPIVTTTLPNGVMSYLSSYLISIAKARLGGLLPLPSSPKADDRPTINNT